MTPRRLAAALLAVAGLLALAPVPILSPLDDSADAWFGRALTSAGAAYATARLLNGSVSVLKESELQLEPAGLGVSLAIGQILDPLDDMTERFSNVVVAAIVALAVERVLHQVAVDLAAPLLAAAFFVLAAASMVSGSRALRRGVGLFLALVLGARLALPVAALVGAGLHERLFASPIEAAREDLRKGVLDLERLTQLDLPREEGFLGTVRGTGELVRSRVELLAKELARLQDRFEGLIEALLALTGLYVASFLLQGVLLPVGALAVLVGMLRLGLRVALEEPRSIAA